MTPLHIAIVWINLFLIAFMAAGVVAWRKSLAKALGALTGPRSVSLLGLIALSGVLVKPFLPHNIWHEQHSLELITGIEAGLYTGGLGMLHGPTYSNVMLLLSRASLGLLSVFSINYLISLAAVFLLFLLVRLVTHDETPAFAAGALLLFLPSHMRLAATESMFVLVEFFLLLTLLLLTIFFKTKDRRHFWLGLAAALLLVHLRAEMMLLLALLSAAYGAALGGKTLLRAARRPAITGTVLAAAALCSPRIVEILTDADPREKLLLPVGAWRHYHDLGLTGLNAFFSPEFTPVTYMFLAAAGLVILWKKNRRFALYLNFHWLVITYFYSLHLSCVSLKVRTAMATQCVFVIFAAYGYQCAARRLRRYHRLYPRILLTALILSAALLNRGFLTRLYTKQQEYRFLKTAARRLPPRSAVAYLAAADDPGLLQNRVYQEDLLTVDAPDTGRPVAVGLKRFIASSGRFSLDGAYFYKGIACYTPTWFNGATGYARPDGDYTHPLCAGMERWFHLDPVDEVFVTNKSLSWDAMEGRRRRIGLYRITGRRRPAGRPLTDTPPRAWAFFTPERPRWPARLGFWVRAADTALWARAPFAALWALRRAEHRALSSPRDARRVVHGYLSVGAASRALDFARRLALTAATDAEPRILMARAAAQSGDKKLAAQALARAAQLGPDPGQRSRMAILYQDLKDYPRALRELDILVGDHPARSRYWSDRGIVNALLGRREDAIGDLRKAISLESAPLTAYLSLGGLYTAAERGEEALKIYNIALMSVPSPGEANLTETIRRERNKLLRRSAGNP